MVTISGYTGGSAMEPSIDRVDGNTLFFNNSNATGVDTNLYFAVKNGENNFDFVGEVGSANSKDKLDAVASMDLNKNYYFISDRNYSNTPTDYRTVYKGFFNNGNLINKTQVEGDFYKREALWIVMDAEISPDGQNLYFVNAHFPGPDKADICIAKYDIGTDQFKMENNSNDIMRNINTEDYLEYAPSISQDELELYFTRATNPLNPSIQQKAEIYVAKRNSKTEAFGVPQLLKLDGFMEAPSISYDKKTLYFHKNDNGIYRIYKLSRKPN